MLGKDELCNKAIKWYLIMQRDLLEVFIGLGKKQTLYHALHCKVGSLLIGGCQSELQDDLGLVATQSFSFYAIHDNPIITKCWDDKKGDKYFIKAQIPANNNESI
eukprot:8721289-Ditylum_brightwellii.AAC.1